MVTLGIDEITIVIKLNEGSKTKLGRHDWDVIAETISDQVDGVLELKEVFGEKNVSEKGNVAGYDHGFEYGNNPVYFRVCYNESRWRMGLVIKFSAQSLAFYKSRYYELHNEHIEVFDLINMLTEEFPEYDVLLSRIDVYADFINEGFSVEEVAKQLEDGVYSPYFSTGKRNSSKIGYYNDSEKGINTVYIGSKGKNCKSLLRIYNKKEEQISQHGSRYEEAITYKDWVRIENEIHGDYAHKITREIANIISVEGLTALIGTLLLNKYTLQNILGMPHPMTLKIKEAMGTVDYDWYYKASNYKDLSLLKSMEYLLDGSGLIPFLYKLNLINEDLLFDFMEMVFFRVDNYIPNKECFRWVMQHLEYYKEHGAPFITEWGKEESIAPLNETNKKATKNGNSK